MARVLVFSDLHAHAWREFSTVETYRGDALNSRLIDSVRVVDHVCRYVQKTSVKHVIFAGDLFHRRRMIDVPVFNAVSRAVWRLARHARVYLLAGNHDLVTRSAAGSFSDVHALVALAKYRGVSVIDTPTINEDLGVGFVPYASDRGTVLDGFERVAKRGVLSIITHIGVSGARAGALEHQPLEPVTVADLPSIPVFSGHYHAPQTIGEHFRYIGAPLEFVRGESLPGSRDRGFIVFEASNPSENVRRVPHRGPRFQAVEWPSMASVRGNFVDVSADPEVAAAEIHAVAHDHRARGVNIVRTVDPKGKKPRLKVKRTGKLPAIPDLCDAYVDAADTVLDRRRLKALARELLESTSDH